jgi:hypothetical protein
MQHQYDVTFQVGGEERVERVEAPDAASAVETIRAAHRGTPDLFELIQVHLLEADEDRGEETVAGKASLNNVRSSR